MLLCPLLRQCSSKVICVSAAKLACPLLLTLRSLLIGEGKGMDRQLSPRSFLKSFASSASVVRRDRSGREFTTSVIHLRSTVCWLGIGKDRIWPPSCRCYPPIWDTRRCHAPKFISTPQRSCWRAWAGDFVLTSPFHR